MKQIPIIQIPCPKCEKNRLTFYLAPHKKETQTCSLCGQLVTVESEVYVKIYPFAK